MSDTGIWSSAQFLVEFDWVNGNDSIALMVRSGVGRGPDRREGSRVGREVKVEATHKHGPASRASLPNVGHGVFGVDCTD